MIELTIPTDPYDPAWVAFNEANPHLPRSVGAMAVDDDEGDEEDESGNEEDENTEDKGGEEEKAEADLKAAAEAKVAETEEAKEKNKSADDWRDTITDPKVRKFADAFTSPADAAKTALDLRQKLSGAITPLGKDASDEDVTAYRKATGVPDTAEKYELFDGDPPEGIVVDDLGLWKEAFHKNNVSAIQAKALFALGLERDAANKAVITAEQKVATDKALSELQTEWGNDFKPNAVLAERAVSVFGGDDLVALVEKAEVDGIKLGDHPAFIKAFATVGRQMEEARPGLGLSEDQMGDMETTHAELTAAIGDASDAGDSAKVKRLDAERSKLSAKMVGTASIVGAEGRAA